MKFLIYTGVILGGIIGGLIGFNLDGGFGIWSILLGGLIGPVAGLFAGYKVSRYLNE